MKIAVDVRSLGSKPSGVGIYIYNFLKELVKYNEFQFVLITDVAESEYIREFVDAGVEVHTYGRHFYGSGQVLDYFSYVKKVLKDIKPDIFWEANTVIPVKLKGDYKIVTTVHDMFPLDYPEYFGRLYSAYFKWSLRKTLKNTDLIIYNSNETKIATEKHFKKYVEGIENMVSYIIVEPDNGQGETKQADNCGQKAGSPEFYDIPQNYFLYVGNMEKRKGVDLLLNAYKEYRSKGGDRKLVLAGKMLEDDINKLLLEVQAATGSLIYKDYVTDKEKTDMYKECACYVFPSRAEGFGMPVIEVMWYEKPIIVSGLSVFDEIAGDCINRFNIDCSNQQQIDNLVEKMFNYNPDIDVELYSKIRERYRAGELAGKLKDKFLCFKRD